MKLNNKDVELINLAQNRKHYSKEELLTLSKEEILNLVDLLGNLVGFDKTKNDIDSLGEEADNVISKLLLILEQRKEI